jgi:hypothetical protein
VWLLLAIFAVAVAGVREELLLPRVGEPAAHVIGTAFYLVLMVLVIRLTLRWIFPGLQMNTLVLLGTSWAAATICFEFGFGHFVMGHPWSLLLHDYNLLAGRVWILVPFTLLWGPAALGQVQTSA